LGKFFNVENRTNTIFWAIIACLLWSTAAPGIKIGLEFSTPLHFAGVRFVISGLLILPFTVRPAVYIRIIRENLKIVMLVTMFQTVFNYILFYMGMDLVPGAIGAIVIGSQPLLIALTAALMIREETLTLRKIVIIIIGISGVILVSLGRQGLQLGTAGELLGVIMILGANTCSAVSNVLVSKKGKGVNPFVLSSFSLLAGGIMIWVISLITEPPFVYPVGEGSESYWISLGWLSLMSAVAFTIWYILLQRPGVKVSDLNFYKFIIPVFGAVISWLLIEGEQPQWLTITGMVVITLSLILYYRCSHQNQAC
jgi:drug/metabolite transporter (DMT)-like permease